MARKLGDEQLGIFVFALAWGEIAMTPVGLGIDQYLLRQVAADRSRLDGYFWNAIRLKLYRGIPVTIASIALVYALDYGRDTKLTVSIITVGLLFDTMARTLQNVFNAFERGELARRRSSLSASSRRPSAWRCCSRASGSWRSRSRTRSGRSCGWCCRSTCATPPALAGDGRARGCSAGISAGTA